MPAFLPFIYEVCYSTMKISLAKAKLEGVVT